MALQYSSVGKLAVCGICLIHFSAFSKPEAKPIAKQKQAKLGIPDIKFDVLPGCEPPSRDQLLNYFYGVKNIARVFHTRLNYPIPHKKLMLFRLICDEQIFLKYQNKIFGKVISHGGYYGSRQGKPEIVLLWKPNDPNSYQGIFHEATHAITAMGQAGALPFWFSEGLAGYFGNAFPEKETLRIAISWRNTNVNKWVESNRFPPLEAFFRLKPDQLSSWEYTREISESLIHFMMEKKQGRDVITKLLEASSEKKDLAQVLKSVYPGGLSRLQKDWENWLKTPRHEHVWDKLG